MISAPSSTSPRSCFESSANRELSLLLSCCEFKVELKESSCSDVSNPNSAAVADGVSL